MFRHMILKQVLQHVCIENMNWVVLSDLDGKKNDSVIHCVTKHAEVPPETI